MFHPLMRVWIEIPTFKRSPSTASFHPLMRVWIEIQTALTKPLLDNVSPSYEGVD